MESRLREQLLQYATQLAATIDPALVKALTFTAADKGTPAFERLRAQLIAYGRYIQQRSIYTMALRDGRLVFGPENLAEDDPWASPPGTVYEQPGREDFLVFKAREAFTQGPHSDEYGTFVSAMAPVIDPGSGEVLMAVGIDVDATEWSLRVERSRLLPNLAALAPFLIFPVVLVLLQWHERRVTGKFCAWPRYGEVAMVATLGLALSGFGGLTMAENESDQRWLTFARLAESRTTFVRDALFGLRSDLASVARFYQGSEQVTRQEFRSFTAPLVAGSGLQAIGWAPRVLSKDRTSYEAWARQDGLSHFAFQERSDQGARQLAADREQYYPLYYVEPLADNASMLGFDLSTDALQRAALETAERTGFVTATDPLVAQQGNQWRKSVVIYQPVVSGKGGAQSGTPQRDVQGFVVAVLDLQSLLESDLTRIKHAVDLQTCLVDLSPADSPLRLASYPSSHVETELRPVDVLPPTQPFAMTTVYPVFVFGRAWAVVTHPLEGFYVVYSSQTGWLIGLAGLLLTGIASALVMTWLQHEASLEQQVMERTAALRETEERFRTLVQQVPAVVYVSVLDEVGTTLYISPQLTDMVGYTPDEWIAQPDLWQRCLHPDDRERVLAAYKAMCAGGAPMNCEYRYIARDGRVVWVHEIASVLHTQTGNPYLYCQGILIDITEQKRAEEERLEMERHLWQSQKLESLGVLAGGIAHDFNNLLTAIQGHLELAQQQAGNVAMMCWHTDAALQAVKRATDLTRQMLAYAGKGQFVLQDIDLNELIKENREILSTSVSHYVTFDLQLAANLPPIRADAGQIQQVIMNLVINAVEAIGEQPGTITLRTGVQECDQTYLQRSRLEEKPAPGPYIFVEVSDTGHGMDKSTLERMFEPFFTTKFTGRGLGMSAVQGIVRAHHGAIMVDSQLGRGTTVRVLFPVAQPAASTVTAASTAAPETEEAPTDATTGTILVIDDEEMVCELLADALCPMCSRVLTAHDGEEGTRLFQEHAVEIECVILDLTMPRQDGIQTYQALRSIRADVPIIITSGYSQQDVLQRLNGPRMDGFLQKPYLLDELRRVVGEVLQRTASSKPQQP